MPRDGFAEDWLVSHAPPFFFVSDRLSGQGGELVEFGLAAKLERDADLRGGLRAAREGRRVVYLRADDAGALLRLLDVYPRMQQGRMELIIDASTSHQAAQDGVLWMQDISDVVDPGLQLLNSLMARPGSHRPEPLKLLRLRVRFKRTPGLVVVSDGIVHGGIGNERSFGATAIGRYDLATGEVTLHGAVVPLFEEERKGAIPQWVADRSLIGHKYDLLGPRQAPALRFYSAAPVVGEKFIAKLLGLDADGADRNRY